MRYEAHYCCRDDNTRLTLKMATRDAKTDFGSFRGLERWARVRVFSDMKFLKSAPVVLIDFILTRPTPFTELRINVNRLFDILYQSMEQFKIVFRQSRRKSSNAEPTKGNIAPEDEFRVTWDSLKEAIYLLLFDIFLYSTSRGLEALPELWIDGERKLINATWLTEDDARTPSASFAYDYGDVDPELLQETMCRMTNRIRNCQRCRHQILATRNAAEAWHRFGTR